MTVIVKSFDWHMAHRLGYGYVGKCTNLHGHTYVCEVAIAAELMNMYDMVIDFEDIKHICKTWVDDHLDHATMITVRDKQLLEFLKAERSKFFLLPPDYNNSTAENIAAFLFNMFNSELQMLEKKNKPKLVSVRIWETPSSSAIFTGGTRR